MKRDALPRKKSENLQNSVTLSKHPNKKERKKTQKAKRRSHLNTHLLHIKNQSTQPNHSQQIQKMEPETEQNSQNFEPSNQIDQYISEIVEYLFKLDQDFLTQNQQQTSDFPNEQISLSMRKTLVKWLYKFATILKLKSQTFHIAVQLIDCVLINQPTSINKANFQLLGVTCLFMAAKLNEVINPEARRFTDACDGLYTLEQLFELEQFVLSTMNFVIQVPTIYQFLNIFIEEENPSKQNQYLIRSLAQLCTYDFNLFNGYTKAHLTAVVIYLWGKIMNVPEIRSKKIMEKYNISSEIFEKCLKELMVIYKKSCLSNQTSSIITN